MLTLPSAPLVSVILTSCNQEAYLAAAAESALAQDYRPLQIVIVDDASRDRSPQLAAELARRYPDQVTFLPLARNRGVSEARNAALALTRGRYVVALDGDDYFLPGKIAREVALAEAAGGRALAYSNFYWIDAAGRETGVWASPGDHLPTGPSLLAMFMCAFPHGHYLRSELMPRDILGQRMNDPQLRIYEDLDLRLRLAAELPLCYCAEPGSAYRRHGAGLSSSRAPVYYESVRHIWRRRRPLTRLLPADQRRTIARKWRRILADHALSAACQQREDRRPGAALGLALRSLGWQPTWAATRTVAACLVRPVSSP